MKAIVEDEHSEDGVKLRSYCQKHSMVKKAVGPAGQSASGGQVIDGAEGGGGGGGGEENAHSAAVRKIKKDMTVEERNLIRAQKYERAFLTKG